MNTFVFIDASNLFYGGKKSLGWSVDFEKLYDYLVKRYSASKIFYFGGEDGEGNQKRKANCDVEMAFYLMKEKDNFERVLVLSGDGDFLPVLKYLRNTCKKEVLILARGVRTAKEIRRFVGDKFMDFTHSLRSHLERTNP